MQVRKHNHLVTCAIIRDPYFVSNFNRCAFVKHEKPREIVRARPSNMDDLLSIKRVVGCVFFMTDSRLSVAFCFEYKCS